MDSEIIAQPYLTSPTDNEIQVPSNNNKTCHCYGDRGPPSHHRVNYVNGSSKHHCVTNGKLSCRVSHQATDSSPVYVPLLRCDAGGRTTRVASVSNPPASVITWSGVLCSATAGGWGLLCGLLQFLCCCLCLCGGDRKRRKDTPVWHSAPYPGALWPASNIGTLAASGFYYVYPIFSELRVCPVHVVIAVLHALPSGLALFNFCLGDLCARQAGHSSHDKPFLRLFLGPLVVNCKIKESIPF